MSGTSQRLAVRAATLLVVLALGLASCGNDDGGDASPVTLPSSLDTPTSTAALDRAPDTTPDTTEPGHGVDGHGAPAADGAPVIRSLEVEPTSEECTDGTIGVVVTFDADPEPAARVFTVVLDDEQVGATTTVEPVEVDGVACDGEVHQVLLIATIDQDAFSTEATAFRTPLAG